MIQVVVEVETHTVTDIGDNELVVDVAYSTTNIDTSQPDASVDSLDITVEIKS